ncbi:MAG: RecQ family ATP-dependent DNA helicase [Treponema sp.]|nr:RecQ family ATP-dependent DNA helicase [Treponema sp.]
MSKDLFSIEKLIAGGLKAAGLRYLYPYQRLVIANILEAARSASIPMEIYGPEENEIDKTAPDNDKDTWKGFGKQIVILPTGAGKSLCFQLPARIIARPTLVIYPILALMADQARRLKEQGARVALIRGGQSAEERAALATLLQEPANTFIIANPEVLAGPPVRALLKSAHIAHVVIDEAHCVSQWGETFRPAYLELGNIISELNPPLVTAFTATASPAVLDKIRHYIFGDQAVHLVMGDPDRPNISYRLVRSLVKEAALRSLLAHIPRPAIVFCSSRSRTEQLARALRYSLKTQEIYFYHAGLERHEKDAVEAWFFSSKKGILVATCAYGLGVDKSDIRSVIHFDCPSLVEAYIQEAGRAGRDGQNATATLLWGPEDEQRSGAMALYGSSSGRCRRRLLLSLLEGKSDEMIQANCTGDESSCDECLGRASGSWREERVLQTLIRQSPRRFTLAEAADFIAKQERLDLSREEARKALSALLARGKLKESRCPLWNKALLV